jgi:hypothetical protein
MTDFTTDPTPDELAERIRRLQARRGPGSQPTADASPPAGQTAKARRRAGAASRILLAGLSVTGFFSIVTAMGVARNNATPATPAATAAATPTATSATPTAASSAKAPVVTRYVSAPVTATRGS